MRTFVKRDPAPLEAAGLRWLADGGARVPSIVEEAPHQLVLQRIEPGRLDAAGEEDLGRMLARLHASGAARFGTLPAAGPFLVGRCELPSPEGDDWNEYYRQHRCLPLARRVGLEAEVANVRVDAPAEPPARLHGDLWSGNSASRCGSCSRCSCMRCCTAAGTCTRRATWRCGSPPDPRAAHRAGHDVPRRVTPVRLTASTRRGGHRAH